MIFIVSTVFLLSLFGFIIYLFIIGPTLVDKTGIIASIYRFVSQDAWIKLQYVINDFLFNDSYRKLSLKIFGEKLTNRFSFYCAKVSSGDNSLVQVYCIIHTILTFYDDRYSIFHCWLLDASSFSSVDTNTFQRMNFWAIITCTTTIVSCLIVRLLAPLTAFYTFTSFYIASVSDPGRITHQNVKQCHKIYDYDYLLYYPKFCSTCHLDRPARAKHCSLCDGCFMKCDHHCIWIRNCVGYKNYRWFIFFLFMNTLACFYCSYICYYLFQFEIHASKLLEMTYVDEKGQRVSVSWILAHLVYLGFLF